MSTPTPPGHTPPPEPPNGPLLPPERRRQPGSGLGRAVVIGVLVLALIAAGAYGVVQLRDSNGPGSAGEAKALPKSGMPSTDPALARFYDQELSWKSCEKANQCADLTVPLDYSDPGGTTIRIAVNKVPATGKAIGSLVVNPGGPGGSGIEYAESGADAFTEPVASRYDLIGFDPRGVDASTRLKCFDTAKMDAYLAQDPDPDTAAERADFARSIKEFGEACEQSSGDLVAHMSTEDVVRDMDVLRQALGEARLTYFGASYGTDIGAKYADLFPTHVGRMVLDGAVDPSQSNEQAALSQAKGFETALRAYVKSCLSQSDCPLGTSADAAGVDAGAKKIHDFIAATEQQPLQTGTSRELTSGLALTGVIEALYSQQLWSPLTQGLTQALDQGNGSILLQLSDLYSERGADGYTGNLLSVLQAVTCLDDDESIPVQQVPSHFAEFEKASPTFGETFAYNLTSCATWPVHSGNRAAPVSAKGAAPIVVIGTTRDPATPYAQAVSLAEQLDSGVLISRDGDGHTGFNQGNSCVDGAVQRYLLAGTVPKNGLRC